jgi:hypothetical protein
MIITDNTKIEVKGKAQNYLIGVVTGRLFMNVLVDGILFSYTITEDSDVTLPENSVATFKLNGGIATVSRVVTRNAMRRVIKGAIRNVINSAGRSYTSLNGASYVLLDSLITLNGAFSLSFTGTFSAAGFYLLSDASAVSTDGQTRLLITPDRNVFIGRVIVSSLSVDEFNLLTNGARKTIEVKRSLAGYVSISSGGVPIGSVNLPVVEPFKFNSIGYKVNAPTSIPNFNGYLYNVFINDTDLFRLDEPFSTATALNSRGGINGTWINRTVDDVTTTEPAQ